jgi:hypothetical protein
MARSIAFAAALLPGKTDADRAALASAQSGQRKAGECKADQHIKEVHGMDLPEGFPPPEQLLDFRA